MLFGFFVSQSAASLGDVLVNVGFLWLHLLFLKRKFLDKHLCFFRLQKISGLLKNEILKVIHMQFRFCNKPEKVKEGVKWGRGK